MKDGLVLARRLRVLHEERQAVLVALYTITGLKGGLGTCPATGVLHKGRQTGLADVVAEDLAGGCWTHPEETCVRLPGPAQTALLSF